MSNSLPLHGLQHVRLPCPSLSPGVCSNSCPSSRWCHAKNSPSVVPFSSCLQSFPASGSFPVSQLFAWDDQSIGSSVSAPIFPMNIQGWLRLGLTGWISLLFKGLKHHSSKASVLRCSAFFMVQWRLEHHFTAFSFLKAYQNPPVFPEVRSLSARVWAKFLMVRWIGKD